MAKKLIVLYGPENKGKTETLNRLIKILLLDGGKIIRAESYPQKEGEEIQIGISDDKVFVRKKHTEQIQIEQKTEGDKENLWDKKVVISYRNKKIVIATRGDYVKHPKENIKFFENQTGDILVTATRDIGTKNGQKMQEHIKEKFEENNIIYIDKSKCMDNQAQAEDIKAFIDEICN